MIIIVCETKKMVRNLMFFAKLNQGVINRIIFAADFKKKNMTFKELNLTKPLLNALDDMGFETTTTIQEKAFPVVMSGRDVMGIAQTGTGKTFAYLLPVLRMLPFVKHNNPRVLILVPTRELVIQVASEVEKLTKYMNISVVGVYGGTNINTQKKAVYNGMDVLVASPGRLIDLAVTGVLRLNMIQKLIIDEVDEMMNLGFRHQLVKIFNLLPKKRQNFSATLTKDVEELFKTYFNGPEMIEAAPTGTPLDEILQLVYHVPNYNTKVNLLEKIISDGPEMIEAAPTGTPLDEISQLVYRR